MSQAIAEMPKLNSEDLSSQDLIIVETTGSNAETCHSTIGELSEWLKQFYLTTEQINKNSNNLIINKDTENNSVTFKFNILDWNNTTNYLINDIVKLNNCFYICLIDNKNINPSNTTYWQRIGYTAGRRINISNNNEISSIGGIEVWAPNTQYSINDFIIYEGKLYQCNDVHTSNSEFEDNKSKWTNIGEGNGIILYENNKEYKKDSLVLYNNAIYLRKSKGTPINWVEDEWICISNTNYANIFIKYSATEPQSDSDMKDTPDKWMGVYIGSVLTSPTNYLDYTWNKVGGEDGFVNIECNAIIKNISIETTDWSNSAPYSYTYIDQDLKNTMAPIVDITFSNDSSMWQDELDAFSNLTRVVCNNGSITFYCLNQKPESTLNLKVRVQGDVDDDSFVSQYEFDTFKNSIESLLGTLNTQLETALTGGSNG